MVTSKMTSINTKKLPAVYHKIDLNKLRGGVLVDIGCGRPETQELICNYLSWFRIEYVPYDRYWGTLEQNRYAENVLKSERATAIVCSNVLNVIQSDIDFKEVIQMIINNTFNTDYFGIALNTAATFITVYEGNKSGVGKITKKDCFQRNYPTKWYLDYLNNEMGIYDLRWKVKKSVITNCKDYII